MDLYYTGVFVSSCYQLHVNCSAWLCRYKMYFNWRTRTRWVFWIWIHWLTITFYALSICSILTCIVLLSRIPGCTMTFLVPLLINFSFFKKRSFHFIVYLKHKYLICIPIRKSICLCHEWGQISPTDIERLNLGRGFRFEKMPETWITTR